MKKFFNVYGIIMLMGQAFALGISIGGDDHLYKIVWAIVSSVAFLGITFRWVYLWHHPTGK